MEEPHFKDQIVEILTRRHGPDQANEIFKKSELIKYLAIKTRSANRGSKARGSFANLYAIYVLVEDYLQQGYPDNGSYADYEGAIFTELFKRQRELPFGEKLQNHALNSRCNEEFKKYFEDIDKPLIVRDLQNSRYWINEGLLVGDFGNNINLAADVIEIIDAYTSLKQSSFNSFIETCEKISELSEDKEDQAVNFIEELLSPQSDARIFEIASFAILKAYHGKETIWIGPERQTVKEMPLVLYKTGRTNANDGGIDFVMNPLGRFYQVTETLDLKKYFLDIEKIQRFPITFVVKSELSNDEIKQKLHSHAVEMFTAKRVVESYMSAIEEIINLPTLRARLKECIEKNAIDNVLSELVTQSRVEFQIAEAP